MHLSKIFINRKDFNDWDKYISYFKKKELPDIDKKRIVNALSYLKINLPKGFLKNASEHYIMKTLKCFTDYSRLELVWIAENLNSFENNKENYNILLNKIINFKKSEIEGIPFLKIGSLFNKKGYEVLFEKDVKNFNKKPDLIVKHNKTLESIYIEVSTLNESDIINKRRNVFNRIVNVIHSNRVCFSGKIYSEINENELNNIERKLQKSIEKCKTYNTIEFLKIKDTIDIAVSSNNKVNVLKKWQEYNNYKIGDLISLNLDYTRDVYRITNNKIKKEAKQIPVNKIGLIVLKTYPYFILFHNIESAIIEIKKELNKYPHIFGLVVYSNVISTQKDFEMFYGEDYYSIKSEFEFNKKITIFILNNKFNSSIKNETYKSVYEIFTK